MDAAAAAIDAEVFAGVVPPPSSLLLTSHANPDPAHGRHELRGHWRVLRALSTVPSSAHELVAKFADMTAKETASEGAWVAAQRGHMIPGRGTAHTPAAGHRGMARLPRKQNCAPALRGLQHQHQVHIARFATWSCWTHGGEPRKPERSRMPLGLGTWDARSGGGRLGSGSRATAGLRPFRI
jgi:hypothetical protein